MVGSNQSINWEDEGGSNHEISMSNILNDQFAQDYLNEQSILNNFSLSHLQGANATNENSNEQCPIGLRLEKTPSFLDFLQMSVASTKSQEEANTKLKRVKAGHFPASSIMIGNWQRFSKHGGDITAKIYYAKHKLVWEILLEEAVKYKMEIQWSNITAIRGLMPKDRPGTLEVELSRPPKYFREVGPTPKQHTVWQDALDFTEGQAPIWRRHIMRFNPGILDEHYEKLMLCDKRLFEMSMKPFTSCVSPYFDQPFHLLCTNDGESKNFNHYITHWSQPQPQPQPQPMPWDQSSSHTNQTYQPTTAGILSEIENHLLGD